MNNKKKPQWLQDKLEANQPKEAVTFVGEMGAAGVVDGKLPNGDIYAWYMRRPDPKKLK